MAAVLKEDATMTTNATGDRTAFWLEEAEVALTHALHAVREARKDAEKPICADGIRGDLTVALHELDHHVGVARATTTNAMRAEGIGGAR